MSEAELIALTEALPQARVLCVGDAMLDHFVYGTVERISPEAPIPVLRIEREVSKLGGAGNVIANLHALGAKACFVSALGADAPGRELARLFSELAGAEVQLAAGARRVTTVKRRYIAETQQMLRADNEQAVALSPDLRKEVRTAVDGALRRSSVTVLSDYGKGVLADGLAGELIAAARAAGHKVIVDPKGRDYAIYRGASVVKPNRRELGEATKMPVSSDAEVEWAARSLIARHGFEAVLVTLSQHGMLLVEASGETHKLHAQAREVYDVSGAGDTVVAAMAAALAIGGHLLDAAHLANVAAGIVVGKSGTAVVHAAELAQAVRDRDALSARKVLSPALAAEQTARWRRGQLKIGFTNGCFDLLHPGHLSLLAEARAHCDRLIVGVNSDASVKRLKGPTRPVQSLAARSAVLASLTSVDLVVPFDEDTPLSLIGSLRPDVLVKGADYTIEAVVGGDLVSSYGGKVVLADIVPGHSTTATIARLAG
ncbi:MAG TPA: D-glycero-beta-D-manno-heptose-7-phosphate kinase [Stellaceae bacterium]|nr:D-glycero-beta-D-manno-heptose-7-phosphate kinase [Stellaceae bacterium]